MGTKKWFRVVERLLQSCGADRYEFITDNDGRGHPKVVIWVGNRHRRVPCSASPSDIHAENQMRRKLRKVVEELRSGEA